MPQTALNNLGINFDWTSGENGWKAGMDLNLLLLDALCQCNVLSATTTAPPGSPAPGDRYLVPTGATGAWSGAAGRIAIRNSSTSTWALVVPLEGWKLWVRDTDLALFYDGTAWRVDYPKRPIIAVAGTSRTLGFADENALVRCSSGSAVTITVPTNATTALPIGHTTTIRRTGTGTVTISPAGGVTVNSDTGLVISTQHDDITLVKVGADEWDAF
jgi:hypothetical protein